MIDEHSEALVMGGLGGFPPTSKLPVFGSVGKCGHTYTACAVLVGKEKSQKKQGLVAISGKLPFFLAF